MPKQPTKERKRLVPTKRSSNKAGRPPEASFAPSRLRHKLKECYDETGGDGTNWQPLFGPMSFVELFTAMGWALRNIDPRSHKSQQTLVNQVFNTLTNKGTKRFGPPKRRGAARTPGPGRPPNEHYDVATFTLAVKGGACIYEVTDLRKAIRVAAKTVDAALPEKGRNSFSTSAELMRSKTPTALLLAILRAAGRPTPHYICDRVVEPMISPAFTAAACLPAGHELTAIATRTLDDLRVMDGPRVVILKGAPLSGRTVTCRFVLDHLKENDHGELTLTDGSALPIVAVSVSDLEPSKFLDQVLKFYTQALGVDHSVVNATIQIPDDASKLEQLAVLAKQFPVFFVLAGFQQLGSNPIVGAIKPNLVAGVFDVVLRATPITRVLVTADTDSDIEGSTIYRGANAVPVIVNPMPEGLSTSRLLSAAYRDQSVVKTIQSWDLPTSGLTLAMSYTVGQRLHQAMKSCAGLPETEPSLQQIFISWRHATATNQPYELLNLLWRSSLRAAGKQQSLLADAEKLLLGMIAASHDGLQFSTLFRVLCAVQSHTDLTWDQGSKVIHLAKQLSNHDALRDVFARLQGIVSVRDSPKLDSEGRCIPGETEPHYTLFDWPRRAILALWFDTNPNDARNVLWFIAREAYQRSGVLANDGDLGLTLESAGRAVHALNALLGSIDFTDGNGSGATPLRPQSMAQHLPSLIDKATKPSSAAAFDFAWRELYQRRLGAGLVFFPSLLADSEARIATLTAFLRVGTPWATPLENPIDDRLIAYAPQIALLGPVAFSELLTELSRAALKLCRLEMVCACKSLGEQLYSQCDAAHLPRHVLVPLMVTHIEASILSGRLLNTRTLQQGRPPAPSLSHHDVPTRSRHDLRNIREHIDRTIADYVPPPKRKSDQESAELRRARALLISRKGELFTLMGDVKRACREFEAAANIEEALSRGAGDNRLLGRSTRRRARALIRRARKSVWRKSETLLCLSFCDAPRASRLRVPHPGVVTDGSVFLQVNTLIERNEKFARDARGPGNAAEVVGVNILKACLSWLKNDNLEAMKILEKAAEHTSSPAMGVELYLDLWGMRAQVMLDAALSLIVDQDQGTWPREGRLIARAFAKVLGLHEQTESWRVAKTLVDRAVETITAMRELGSRGFEPTRIFSDYLSACARALCSQLLVDAKAVQDEMAGAALEFASVVSDMNRSGYKLFEQEAKQWRDLLVAALDRERTVFSD